MKQIVGKHYMPRAYGSQLVGVVSDVDGIIRDSHRDRPNNIKRAYGSDM